MALPLATLDHLLLVVVAVVLPLAVKEKARSGAAAAAAADDDEDDDGRIGAGILVLASVAIVGGFVVAPIHCLAQIIPSGF